MSGKHGDSDVGNNHSLRNWVYANSTARLAATGFTADGIGKFAKQTDDGSYWELTAVDPPAWVYSFGGDGSGIQLDITIGTESGNTIDVDIQVQDLSGNNLSVVYGFTMWLSDSTSGALTATAPDTDFSLNDGFELVSYVTDKMKEVITDDSGVISLSIEHTAAKTWYLCLKMPNGTIRVSDAITFT